jgi:hypothetical protein
MRSLLRVSALLLGPLLAAAFVPRAVAQDAPPPGMPPEVTAAELRTLQTAVGRALGAEDWTHADALLDPVEDRLRAWEDWAQLAQLGCERAVLHLRAPHAMSVEYLREVRAAAGNGLASAGEESRRFECLRLVGLSFQSYAALPELPDDVRGMALESAALFLSRARASRDSAALRQSYEAIPEPTRREVEALVSALRAQPVARAIGAQPSAEAVAAAIAHATYLQNPLRQASCGVDLDVPATREGAVTVLCVYEAYPLRGASSLYPTERFFVEAPAGGPARAIGMMRDMDLRDLGAGVVYEVRSFSRLTAAQHGFDGYLFSWREGYELGGERRIESFVTICDRTTGLCQRLDVGRDTCAPDARGRPSCSEGWEADVAVVGGRLTLARARRPRRGARRDPLPADLETSHDLRAQYGANATREGTPALVPDPPIGRHCRLVVRERGAGLTARATPSARGASAGNVPNETAVAPVDRRVGWVRITAPVAGWIPSRNLQRICD